MTNFIHIAIIDYPNALQSAVYGLKELFVMANKLVREEQLDKEFVVTFVNPEQKNINEKQIDIVILPPNLDGNYYNEPPLGLINLLKNAHQSGAILCSGCAGAFILAHTGLLNNRTATTHWQLAEKFSQSFPKVSLNVESLLINDGRHH